MNRKPIEEALRANEEQLRLALDAARLATWDWDIASGNVVWNDQHYRVLGYEPGAFRPSYQFWADRVHPEDLPAAEAKIRQTMADGSEYVNRFRTLRKKQWFFCSRPPGSCCLMLSNTQV